MSFLYEDDISGLCKGTTLGFGKPQMSFTVRNLQNMKEESCREGRAYFRIRAGR